MLTQIQGIFDKINLALYKQRPWALPQLLRDGILRDVANPHLRKMLLTPARWQVRKIHFRSTKNDGGHIPATSRFNIWKASATLLHALRPSHGPTLRLGVWSLGTALSVPLFLKQNQMSTSLSLSGTKPILWEEPLD